MEYAIVNRYDNSRRVISKDEATIIASLVNQFDAQTILMAAKWSYHDSGYFSAGEVSSKSKKIAKVLDYNYDVMYRAASVAGKKAYIEQPSALVNIATGLGRVFGRLFN